jgi:AcrR family transcriptional regulator
MAATNPAGKREDPRVVRTRKLLNQAFFELMDEKGFQAITVQDVADRAGVNRATFYAHYEDKYDLLDRYSREGIRAWLEQKSSTSAEFSADGLRQLVATVLESLAAMDAHCGTPDKQVEPMLEAAVQEELAGFLMEWFTRAPETSQSLSLRQHPETVALLWSWAIFGAGVQWSRGSKGLSAAARAAQVVDALTGPVVFGETSQNRQAQWVKS